MKKLFKEQSISLYKVQKDLNLEIKRLYRYADGTCSIESMPVDLLKVLAKYFEISIDELYNKMIEYKRERKENENNKH